MIVTYMDKKKHFITMIDTLEDKINICYGSIYLWCNITPVSINNLYEATSKEYVKFLEVCLLHLRKYGKRYNKTAYEIEGDYCG